MKELCSKFRLTLEQLWKCPDFDFQMLAGMDIANINKTI